MCGLAGVARVEPGGVGLPMLRRMAAALRHRGPDGEGYELGAQVGLAHTRLSIIDLAHGAQPITNEDGRLAIVYNGEIFNFPELRRTLEALGHRFRTRTDTEVVLHGWEEWGETLLPRLEGQFAFALVDRRDRSVVLARDRFGVLPLYHHQDAAGDLVFGSEMKALFASGLVPAEPDPAALDEIFTFWAVRPPRTPFRGVRALRPGHWLRWQGGRLEEHAWYRLGYPLPGEEAPGSEAALDALLRAAVRGRLLADVPVGGYLSGGLDSSAVAALAAREGSELLRTFSVAFADPRFDERRFQEEVAGAVGSRHAVAEIGAAEIGAVFPEVVRHAETPLVRSAPAPLYLLSRLTRERGITVVLSGEGSDELFWGYDLFKDTAVRRFCLRHPASARRPRLFDRLYAEDRPAGRGAEFWRASFLAADDVGDPLFSHLPRIRLTQWIRGFYADDFAAHLRDLRTDPLAELRAELPADFARWSPVQRAAYLEITTLLSPYLLSSQGDRMAMAHGVELRVPFLDHRVAEFAVRLPESQKLLGLKDKVLLRRWAARVLPPGLARRPKQPYRAPALAPFVGPEAPAYVDDLLTPAALAGAGVFDPGRVAALVRRARAGQATGMREHQALVAVISTQLWHHTFLGPSSPPRADDEDPRISAPVAGLQLAGA
ncbi:MAG TPA: asparagine synthase (glutamine-hydrolyzing) [Gemmatimonadales bacterium]|nr:asparagine synthase (glutamine-hydrolyzing) [Gemmatimonadales bacterium]